MSRERAQASRAGCSVSGGRGGRVLVTGASGLIGSHVVQALLQAGYRPRAFSRRPPAQPPADVEHVTGDVRDPQALARALRGCCAAIHTAAVYSYSRADLPAMMSSNVAGTANVLDAAARTGVERVVVTSSSATCGPVPGRAADEHDAPPVWELAVPYKRSKLAAERAALARASNGQDIVIVNPTTTVGAQDHRPTPSGCIVRDVMSRRIRGYITSGGLNVVAAEDVARGHVLALERGRSGERYLLGGENLPMRHLFELIAQLAGVPAPRWGIPYSAALGAATLVDALARATTGREPRLLVLDEVRLARLPMYFSIGKAQTELGYAHRPPAEALSAAVAWFAETEAMVSAPREGVGPRAWGTCRRAVKAALKATPRSMSGAAR
jgi:dihydroflavonol-4-reductase